VAAPHFEDDEVDQILQTPKLVPWEDWNVDKRSRESNAGVSKRCVRLAAPDMPGASLIMEVEHRARGRATEHLITLHAGIPPRPPHPVCRYDIQNAPHRDHRCCGVERFVPPRHPHRHVYSPRCVEQMDGPAWDNCTELLPDDVHSGDLLWFRFLQDLRITFSSTDAHQDLLGFIKDGD